MLDDIRPSTGRYPTTHEHKYFLFETRLAYEPHDQVMGAKQGTIELYQRVEYAVLSCNCGDVIKRKVRDDQGTQVGLRDGRKA